MVLRRALQAKAYKGSRKGLDSARLISEAPKSGEVELLSPPISRRLKKDNMDNDLELAIALSKTLMVRLNTPGHAFAPLHLH